MSQLAVFNLIEVSKLPELCAQNEVVVIKKWFRKKYIHPYWDYLQGNSTLLYGLAPDHYNGAIFINIILYLLKNKGLNLQDSTWNEASTDITEKQQLSTLILTRRHCEQFHEVVNPQTISEEECRSANIEFSDEDSNEAALDFREALIALQKVLSQIPDENSVVIFTIV